MDNSFFSRIQEMKEPEWNYYFGHDNNIPLNKPFVSAISAKEFIGEYFHKGGKDLITQRFELENFKKERADHTVSIFFLGILLYHNTELKNKIFYDGPVSDKYEFFYFIWFITCLGHDFAFYLERDLNLLANITSIESLVHQKGIIHNLLEVEVEKVPKALFQNTHQYFQYRHAKKRLDHGIYAGIVAYDALVENRLNRKGAGDVKWLWADYLDKEYAYASATIAVHNMWIPEQEKIQEYEESGLTELIGMKRIGFNEAPLLYFLGLVDTLDPVKAFKDEDPEVVLQTCSIQFQTPTSFTITSSDKAKISVLKQKGVEVSKWVQVEIGEVENGISVTLLL